MPLSCLVFHILRLIKARLETFEERRYKVNASVVQQVIYQNTISLVKLTKTLVEFDNAI